MDESEELGLRQRYESQSFAATKFALADINNIVDSEEDEEE